MHSSCWTRWKRRRAGWLASFFCLFSVSTFFVLFWSVYRFSGHLGGGFFLSFMFMLFCLFVLDLLSCVAR